MHCGLDWLSLLGIPGLCFKNFSRAFRSASDCVARGIFWGLGSFYGKKLGFVDANSPLLLRDGVMSSNPAVSPSSSSLSLSLQSISLGDGTLKLPAKLVIGIGVFVRTVLPVFAAFLQHQLAQFCWMLGSLLSPVIVCPSEFC